MPYREITPEHTFFSAKGATGVGVPMKVSEFNHIIVTVATDGGGDAALTAKCQGAVSKASPTFGSAQSVTNMWDFIAMWDYQSGTVITGDTGFVVATADDYRIFMVNMDGLQWINFNVTARSEGEVTIKAVGFTNL